ncbi:MAG: hypothetical protein ACLR5S_11740 [Ruminococcus sp.]
MPVIGGIFLYGEASPQRFSAASAADPSSMGKFCICKLARSFLCRFLGMSWRSARIPRRSPENRSPGKADADIQANRAAFSAASFPAIQQEVLCIAVSAIAKLGRNLSHQNMPFQSYTRVSVELFLVSTCSWWRQRWETSVNQSEYSSRLKALLQDP